MDYISSPNIFSISTCDLNTKFNGRCHSDWSRTNLIAVVTQEGIYILQPQLERAQEPFEIDLIRNPNEPFRHSPFERNNISFEDIWSSLDNRQYLSTYLDPALLTNVTRLSGDSYLRRFRLAKWSPLIKTFPVQCLLTTITVDFQLVIYSHRDGVWVIQEDLSRIYDELWAQTILADKLLDKSFNSQRENLHSLSFNSVCWRDSREPMLLSATLTGDLILWNVNLSNSTQVENQNKRAHYQHDKSYQRDKIDFSVGYILRTGQEYINLMQLYQNLLITTSRNGQINLYDLSLIFEESDLLRQQQQINKTDRDDTARKGIPPQIIDMQPTAILCQSDNIEVMDFYLQPLTTSTFRVVLTKSTNICWLTIHYNPKTDMDPVYLAISESLSAINGLNPEMSLHQTPATWLRPAGQTKAVLIADDGSFFQMDFLDDRHDTSPTFNAIRTGKIDLTDMTPKGLCTSPNGMLVTMISSVTYIVDPLKIPAPTKLILLPLTNERNFFIECMQSLLDENWLTSQNVTSPMDVCDRIDSIRSMIPHLNHYQFERMKVMLNEEIGRLAKPKTSTQLVMLKILSFILLKLEDLHSMPKILDDDQDNNETEAREKVGEQSSSAHDVILVYSIERVFKRVFMSSLDEMNAPLTEHQVRSLRNYFSWLELSSCGLVGQQLRDKYADKFNHLMKMYAHLEHESCPICQGVIEFQLQKFGTCANEHQFVRCTRSLLILDTSLEDTIECRDCKRNYLSRLIWPAESLWLCLYCQ